MLKGHIEEQERQEEEEAKGQKAEKQEEQGASIHPDGCDSRDGRCKDAACWLRAPVRNEVDLSDLDPRARVRAARAAGKRAPGRLHVAGTKFEPA